MKERRRTRKRVGFNLFGDYLTEIYGKLGIKSDRELSERTERVGTKIHQTTISTIKRTHRADADTLQVLLAALRTYPLWKEEYIHDFYLAADRADPGEREKLGQRLRKK